MAAFGAYEGLVGWRYLLRRRRRPHVLIAGLLFLAVGAGLAALGWHQLQGQGQAIAVFGEAQGIWRLVLSIGGGVATFGGCLGLFGLLNAFLTVFSAFSAFMVTIGVAEVILVLGVMNGFQGDLRRKIIDTQAHVMIEPAANGEYLSDYKDLAAKARKVAGVVGATPILRTDIMLSAPTNLAAVALQGVDPDSIGEASTLPGQLKHGTMADLADPSRIDRNMRPNPRFRPLPPPDERPVAPPSDGEDAPEADPMAFPEPVSARAVPPPTIFVGEELRRSLSLWPGESVNAVSPFGDLGPEGPIPRSRPFRLGGWFESGMLEYDTKLAYASLLAVQRFMGLDDVAGAIQIRVVDLDAARAVRDALQAVMPAGVRVTDWQERNSNLFSALKLEKVAMFLVLTINIMLAAFSIISTLVMTIIERRREIAILMAMGSSSGSIVRIFMSQGVHRAARGPPRDHHRLIRRVLLANLGLPLNPEVSLHQRDSRTSD
ncbi:MAG: ABC transporter permease [bacterium]